MNTKCINCGAEIGLHKYDTMQCPVGGVEAAFDRPQEWQRSVFTIDQIAEYKQRLVRVLDKREPNSGAWQEIKNIINKTP